MKFLNDERKTPSALRSVTSRQQNFSEPNRTGFKARTIAANATCSASLKGLFILINQCVSLLETTYLSIVLA